MTEFRGKWDDPARIVTEFNMLFPDIDRLIRQNSSVKTKDMNNIINHLDLIDICFKKTAPNNYKENILFNCT